MWHEWEEDRLKTLWSEGWSASQIARMMLGKTKGSIIGKVNRMKLPERKRRQPLKTEYGLFNVWVERKLYDEVIEFIEEKGMTKSSLVRRLLKKLIAEEKNHNGAKK